MLVDSSNDKFSPEKLANLFWQLNKKLDQELIAETLLSAIFLEIEIFLIILGSF